MNEEILKKIIQKLVKGYSPKQIFLFGSAVDAKKYQLGKSDVDLLLIKNTEFPYKKRYAQARSCLRDFDLPFDIFVYTEEELKEKKEDQYSIVNEALSKGKKIYEQ